MLRSRARFHDDETSVTVERALKRVRERCRDRCGTERSTRYSRRRGANGGAARGPLPGTSESDRLHCDALTRVQLLNNFSYELRCESATVELMSEWLHRREHVDLIDIDIQGAELDLLRGIKHKLDKHVQRIIVGTHSKEIHETPCQLFSDWIILHDSKPAKDTACIVNLLRRNYDESKAHSFEWDEILSTGCFQDSEFGPICNWDGELILDNPAFVTA